MNVQNKNKQHWGSCTEHQVSIKPNTEGEIHQELVPIFFLKWGTVKPDVETSVSRTSVKDSSCVKDSSLNVVCISHTTTTPGFYNSVQPRYQLHGIFRAK